MSSTGRAFVAVVPPAEVLDAIGSAVGSLRERMGSVRWTPRKQWHLTIQFLGNHVDLDTAASALGALRAAGGQARFGSAGAIPNERRGRVLWIGLTEGAEMLSVLAGAVATVMRPIGYEPEHDRYHPHLTVARMKQPGDLHEPVAALRAGDLGPSWLVEELLLVHSETKPTGAEHAVVATTTLSR